MRSGGGYAAQSDPSRAKPRREIGAPDFPPGNFDPATHPILARHWFGIEPRRQTSDTVGVMARLQRQRRIEHLHRLGPRAVGELLYEVSEGEDLDRGLEAFAHLTPDLLKALGADRFPAQPIHVVRP